MERKRERETERTSRGEGGKEREAGGDASGGHRWSVEVAGGPSRTLKLHGVQTDKNWRRGREMDGWGDSGKASTNITVD